MSLECAPDDLNSEASFGIAHVVQRRTKLGASVAFPLSSFILVLSNMVTAFGGAMDERTHEVRISVAGLTRKMYVSRLDRPWLGTSFPLEGLHVQSADDIARVRSLCHFVYIDLTRGVAPDVRYIEFEPSELLKRARSHDEIVSLRKTTWAVSSKFATELPEADKAHRNLEKGIEEVLDDVQNGRNLEVGKLKAGVEAMIDSITRNPAAFIWLKAIKRTSGYAYQHALGSSIWAASFGRHLGMSRDELSELALIGLLFDVGKTRLPPHLLNMTAPFSASDQQQMHAHVQAGVEILEKAFGLSKRIIEAVATHHERHDGSGYPKGLHNGQIPIFGRITGLVDSYDAMTSVRPNAGSLSPHQAVMELYHGRDTLFQADLVEQFIQTCGVYPTGSLVELSDGRVGVVSAVHDLKRLRPSVMILLDANKSALREFYSIDLSGMQEDADGYILNVKRGLNQGAFGIDTAELFLD
jgi:HD-GYP domain-containing protein (c-di-GMP phosphodiesterase class II)